MSFLSKHELPTSVKSTIKIKGKTYYHRKSVMSETDRDEAIAEEKKKGRLVKVKLYQKKTGSTVFNTFTYFAIYSTK